MYACKEWPDQDFSIFRSKEPEQLAVFLLIFFVLQDHVARIGDTFAYLARNVHRTKTPYEKAMVAYALSFAPDQYKSARKTSYERLKATAMNEIYQGKLNIWAILYLRQLILFQRQHLYFAFSWIPWKYMFKKVLK